MIGAPQRDSEERSINAIKQDTASVTGTRAFSSAWQRERGQASGWTHEIQTNPIHWETSGPLGATLQGHGQKFKGFILGKYAWKISLLTPPPQHQCHFPQAKQLIYWQDAANILWSLNHETRRGERDGDLMTANRRRGTVSPISSLCGTLLSDKRSCTTPDLSHVLLIARRATQHNGDVFGRLCVWEGEGGRIHNCDRVHFVLIFVGPYVCWVHICLVFPLPALFLFFATQPEYESMCWAGGAVLCPCEWVWRVWVKAF